jgi:hypothetical protein
VLKSSFRRISTTKFVRKLLNVGSPQTLEFAEITALAPFSTAAPDFDNYPNKKEKTLSVGVPQRTCYNFGSLESGSSTTSPWSSFLSERGFVRQLNSSSRFRISSADVSRALQCSQSGLWILRRTNR